MQSYDNPFYWKHRVLLTPFFDTTDFLVTARSKLLNREIRHLVRLDPVGLSFPAFDFENSFKCILNIPFINLFCNQGAHFKRSFLISLYDLDQMFTPRSIRQTVSEVQGPCLEAAVIPEELFPDFHHRESPRRPVLE